MIDDILEGKATTDFNLNRDYVVTNPDFIFNFIQQKSSTSKVGDECKKA
jgi:hypothetical protein